ncbi:MAG: bifunctional phosphoribosylaminoimidazolecarboxamide formyltransferase/IMP cyclohydrolase [Methanotrichaceae archaeon]|nr:bifunctional phosphoribosylaminoimidazolecarboxamide formyltransferase/IMP cyclohydrolase [Methanotrichaceae archaeon]
MQIKQAIFLAGVFAEAEALRGLEELGLQISNHDNYNILKEMELSSDWSDRLLIPPPTLEGPHTCAVVRCAADCGSVVLVDPEMYGPVVEELRERGDLSIQTRRDLAARALFRIMLIESRRLASLQGDGLGSRYLVKAYELVQDLRYGENWHQKAALYRSPGELGLFRAKKLCGKELSYNNVVDAESVLEMLIDLSEYDGRKVERDLSVIVKHANPCGIAYGESQEEAYRLAFSTDPKSAFGGVIGFNRIVSLETAKAIGESFVEVLIAPGYDDDALEFLISKPNRRILDLGDMLERGDDLYRGYASKTIMGGLLAQDYDCGDIAEWRVVTKRSPTEEETRALRFAWKVTKYVKSNSLVYATADRTIGIGSGQVSRVDSARFGAEKAEEHGLDTRGTVAATDSFFPFRDGLDAVHLAGATAVVHPGGSIRDAEVISAADEHDMAMVFTRMRHFRH